MWEKMNLKLGLNIDKISISTGKMEENIRVESEVGRYRGRTWIWTWSM